MADINISALPILTQATNDDYIILNDGNATTSIIDWEDLKESIDRLTGQIVFDTGTEAAPSITFSLDQNTGIYSPGLDQMALVTNGDTALYVDATGKIGVGNQTPSSFNSASSDIVLGSGLTDSGLTMYSATGSAGLISFADGTTGDEPIRGQIGYYHSGDYLAFHTAGAEVARFDSQGRIGLGTTEPQEVVHVSNGASGVTGTLPNVSGAIIEAVAGTDAAVQLHASATDACGIYFGDPGRLDAGFVEYDHADDSFKIQVNGIPILNINNNGRVGLNAPATDQMLALNAPATGDSTLSGFEASSQIQADVVTDFRYYKTEASTSDAVFTLGDLYHYSATQNGLGASSTVTNQYGYHAAASIAGATNNYGYYSAVNGTNNYGFYASGNASNYFNGGNFTVAVGGASKLAVDTDGLVTIAETLKMEPGSTADRPGTPSAGMFRFNSETSTFEGYDGTEWGAIAGAGGSSVTISSTAPADPEVGDMWYNSTVGNTYIYYFDGDSNQWVESSPSAAGGLFPNTVTSESIQDGAVTTDKYGNNSITTNKLANDAVTALKIADDTITVDKLDPSIKYSLVQGDTSVTVADTGTDGTITFTTDGAEAARFDNGGRLLVGPTTSTASASVVIEGSTANANADSHLLLSRGSTDPGASDAIGSVEFAQLQTNAAAAIVAARDGGTWTQTSSHPTSISIKTTADGSATPTERVKVNANGTTSFSGCVNSTEGTITDGSFDLSAGNFWTAGAIAVPNPTNAVAGTSGLIRLSAEPLSWAANFKFPGGAAPAVSAFPAMIAFYVQGPSTILMGSVIEGIV